MLPLGWSNGKKKKIISVGKDVKKSEISYIASENKKQYNHCQNALAVSKNRITILPSHSGELKQNKNMYTNVYSSIWDSQRIKIKMLKSLKFPSTGE